MSKLIFDHIYRVMNKEEYLELERLGFNIINYETKHEGSVSRFIRFKKAHHSPGSFHYTYLEFIDLEDLTKYPKREGLCFSVDDFEKISKIYPKLKLRHKNYDWYNDYLDSSPRLGWNFAEREEDLMKSFKCWIINYEYKNYELYEILDHPNTSTCISKIIFKSYREFNKVVEDFNLNRNSEAAVDVPIVFAGRNEESKQVIDSVVLKCKDLFVARKYVVRSGYKYEDNNESIYVYLPNIGYNLIFES